MSEQKRIAVAILLSILSILVFTELRAPKKEIITTNQEQQSISNPPSIPQNSIVNNNQVITPSVNKTNQSNLLDKEQVLNSKKTTIITSKAKYEISHLGARFTSLKIIDFKEDLKSKKGVNLIDQNLNLFPPAVFDNNLSDLNVNFQISSLDNTASSKGEDKYILNQSPFTISFKGNLSNGKEITKSFTFYPDSYLFDLNITLDSETTFIEWYDVFEKKLNSYNVRQVSQYINNTKVKRVVDKKADLTPISNPSTWITIGDNYFINSLINPNGVKQSSYFKRDNALTIQTANKNLKIYAGPNSNKELKKVGFDLPKIIDLGFFAIFGKPLLDLINFFFGIFGNYGLAIVIVTILIKIFLLPLTKTSFKSMKAMQTLKPEMDALRKRVTDPKDLQKEMFALYKKKGVNPLGGCLPMVLQFPIFLGMYNALRSTFELRHADFALWINDLSSPESLEVFGISLPIMILLMGLSMFLQQLTNPSTGLDPNAKKMMFFMPIIFTGMFIIFPFPSGLVLYWLVNNLISIIQQYSLKSDKFSPLKATFIGSIAIFAIAFILTLIPWTT